MINLNTEPKKAYYFLLSLIPLTMFLPSLKVPVVGSVFVAHIGEIFMLFSAMMMLLFVIRRRVFLVNRLTNYVLLFVFVSFFSLINVTDIGRYLIGLVTYIEVLLILLLFSNISFTEKQSYKMIKYFLMSSLLISVPIIYKTIVENGGNFLIGNKITLDIGASNYLASLLLIPFFLLLTKVARKSLNFVEMSLFVATGVSILFTASRTAIFIMVGFTIVFLSYDLIFSRKISVLRKIKSICLFVVALVAIFYFGENFIDQMFLTGRFSNLSEQSNVWARFDIFEHYFDSFQQNLFFGNGFLNVKPQGENTLAHNTFLQILGDNGLFGFMIFLFFIIYLFKFLNKVKKDASDFLSDFVIGYKRAFWAVFVHGMFEPNFGTKLFMLYFFLGIGIIISSYRGNSRAKSKAELEAS